MIFSSWGHWCRKWFTRSFQSLKVLGCLSEVDRMRELAVKQNENIWELQSQLDEARDRNNTYNQEVMMFNTPNRNAAWSSSSGNSANMSEAWRGMQSNAKRLAEMMQRQWGWDHRERLWNAEWSLEQNQVWNMPEGYYADDSQTGDVSCGAILASWCTQGRAAVDSVIGRSPPRVGAETTTTS